MRPVRLMAACAALLIPLSQCFAQAAQQPEVPPAVQQPEVAPSDVPQSTAAPSLTQADVDAWLDGFMPYALQTGDVAGAVVVVVKDGAILTEKGYGYADVAARKPVDPKTTLFRPGSVSKLFTWTAVMQLVEQGKLDLDTDVNTYLDFKIPPREGKPITLRNIMTHTPGFEEQAKGIMGVPEDGVPELGAILKRWIPTRIFAPGETPAYSNYATALAGYIVARTSGMSFDDYVDQHLFQPLGMSHSTFRQPLPDSLQPLMSKGYRVASMPPMYYEIVGPAPAGSLASTGEDMGHFMIAHLQNGRYGDKQILKPETAKMMHTTPLTILPRLNRMMLGFYETNYNGHRVIGHGGDTQWFHSYLHLFMDDGVGLFVSVNSMGKDGAAGSIRGRLFSEFADRYFPGPAPDGKVDAKTAAEHARMIAGNYVSSRRMETTFLSFLNLFGEAKIIDNGDGTISLSMAKSPSGVMKKWREIEPFVWRDVDSKELLGAKAENGRVVRFSINGGSPFMMFDRPSAAKASSWLLPAFIGSMVALLLTALAWPISALTRRHYGAKYTLAGTDARAHRWVRIAAAASVLVLAGWGWLDTSMLGDMRLLSHRDGMIYLLQILSFIVFIGGAAVGVWHAMTVLRSSRSWYAKLWSVVLALSLLVLLWIALAFHLISFGANF